MKAIDLSVSPAPLIYCYLLGQRNGVANCLTMSVSCFWQILDTEGGYLEGPIWEVRFKALDCGSWDALCLLGWQEDLVVNRIKSSGQIQQDKYWRNGIRSCKSYRASTTESKAVSVECPLLKPDWLLPRRLFCVRKAETWLNTTRSSVLETICSSLKEMG